MKIQHMITALGILAMQGTMAQGKLVDSRDQARGWYVPVHGQTLINGKKTGDFEVILYRDAQEVGRIKGRKKGNFALELNIDASYAIRVIKKGYHDKLIFIDTTLPADLVKYPDYLCFVNLVSVDVQEGDPFYNDFPSAIIRYDPVQGGFYHSDNYLAHIQTRLHGFAKAGR